MSTRRVDDVTYHTTADYSSPKGTQYWRKVELGSQLFLKFILGFCVGVLIMLWYGVTKHTDMKAMRDYAIAYANEINHQ